jgi:predicted DNA-binding transcriptional regulator AlpA
MKTTPAFKLKATATSRPKVPTASSAPRATTLPTALAEFDRLPDAANVRLPIVMGVTGASAPTVWRWSKEGRLPSPRKLGPGITCWNVGQLRAALARA